MGRRCALLDPADVQGGGGEILVPAQVHQLARPEAVAVGHQDHRAVPMAPAVRSGCFEQLLDLGLGQVLARPELGIWTPCRGNCSFFARRHSFRCNLAIEFRLPAKGTVRRIGHINSVQHLHEVTALPKSTIVRLCGPSLLFLDGGGQA